jgi:hypothetical protein
MKKNESIPNQIPTIERKSHIEYAIQYLGEKLSENFDENGNRIEQFQKGKVQHDNLKNSTKITLFTPKDNQ